jgi:predicted ribosome quality control (RQC) complex YloA/Tae2 family protein
MNAAASSGYLDKLNARTNGKDEERCAVLQQDSCVLYIGQNAISNEKMIYDHAHKECLVFHAFGAKGSYVILCSNESGHFTDGVIRFAAETAIKNSRSEMRAVTYGFLKDLYKPDDAPVGVFKWASSEQIEL